MKPTGVHPYFGDDNIEQKDTGEKKTCQDYLYSLRHSLWSKFNWRSWTDKSELLFSTVITCLMKDAAYSVTWCNQLGFLQKIIFYHLMPKKPIFDCILSWQGSNRLCISVFDADLIELYHVWKSPELNKRHSNYNKAAKTV